MTVHIPLSPYIHRHKCFFRVSGRRLMATDAGDEMWILFECDNPHCEKQGLAAPWVFTGGPPDGGS